MNLTFTILVLTLVGLAVARRGGELGRPRRALAVSPGHERRDLAVERLGDALAAGLRLRREGRSHRRASVALAGELEGRRCGLRISPRGVEVQVSLRGRLPKGIHLRRGAPGSRPRVDMGSVRGEVPRGLVPTLLAACGPALTRLSLSKGRLELEQDLGIVGVESVAGRPEEIVALLRRALHLAEQLEREFRGL